MITTLPSGDARHLHIKSYKKSKATEIQTVTYHLHIRNLYKLHNYNRLKLQRNLLNYEYRRLSVHKRIIRENEAKKNILKNLLPWQVTKR